MALKYFVKSICMFGVMHITLAFTVDYINQHLTGIPNSSTTGVTELYITKNNIPVIRDEAFLDYPSLIYLTLRSNRIRYIENHAFDYVYLKSLDLSFNDIVQLPIAFGPSTHTLSHIYLQYAFNEVLQLASPYFNDFDGVKFLKYYSRDDNKYFNASLIPINLYTLDIRNTFLDIFPNLPNYAHRLIFMIDCGISYIPRANMAELNELQHLKLENNVFGSLPDISFMAKLNTLSVKENNLNTLPDLYNCPLDTLQLWGNPWVCNYSLCWVGMWPFVKPALAIDNPVCAEPTEDAGTLLMDIDPVKMQCYEGNKKNVFVS